MDPADAWCLPAAQAIAENLLRRARSHVRQLYWDPGFSRRPGVDRQALERSLGFGTPGVLLFLAHLHAIAPDPRIPACIRAAMPRLIRLLETGSTSGFYVGVPGALYALSEVQRHTGLELVTDVAVKRLAARAITDEGSACDLANGHAGTLVALDLLQQAFPALRLETLRHTLLDRIVEAMSLVPAGLVCGRQFDAIRMPVGFYSGTAGIRHVLSRYRCAGIDWLCEGLARYEDACFDPVRGHWPDLVNEEFFNDPDHASRLNQAMMRGDIQVFEQAGDSIGWATGTAGMLLANRARGADGARECGLIRRRVPIGRPLEQSMDLFAGAAGIALSTAGLPFPAAREIQQELLGRARSQFEAKGRFRTGPWEFSADLSLLHGEAGIGLYLLSRITAPGFLTPVLFPVPVTGPGFDAERYSLEAVRTRLQRRHFPLTTRLDPRCEVPEAPTLSALIESATRSAERSDELTRQVCAYECLRLTEQSAAPSSIFLACRETYTEELIENLLSDAEDAAVFGWRVRRALQARLGVLPFMLPTDPGGQASAGRTLLLLHHRTDGLREYVLTPEGYQLVALLDRPMRVKAAYERAKKGWPLQERPSADARAVFLAEIRTGLKQGYLDFL